MGVKCPYTGVTAGCGLQTSSAVVDFLLLLLKFVGEQARELLGGSTEHVYITTPCDQSIRLACQYSNIYTLDTLEFCHIHDHTLPQLVVIKLYLRPLTSRDPRQGTLMLLLLHTTTLIHLATSYNVMYNLTPTDSRTRCTLSTIKSIPWYP